MTTLSLTCCGAVGVRVMPSNKEYIVGIYFNLPKEVASKILRVQSRLKVGYKGNYNVEPHVTLYLCKFDEKKLDKLYRELQLLKLKPFKINLGTVKEVDHRGKLFYKLSIRNKKLVFDLHKRVLEKVNNMRGDLVMNKDLVRMKNGEYNEQEVELIQEYGSKRVMDNFKPHVSLGLADKDWAEKNKIYERLKEGLKVLRGKDVPVDAFQVSLFKFIDGRPKSRLLSRQVKF